MLAWEHPEDHDSNPMAAITGVAMCVILSSLFWSYLPTVMAWLWRFL